VKIPGVTIAGGFFRAVAGLSIIVVAVVLYVQTHGLMDIPCVMDCGETFVALGQANQFHRYGFAFGLLQDHATSDLLAAHPYLYTHNVSLPSLLFPLLAWSGLHEISQYQMLTLAASVLGLAYIYLAILRISRSPVLAMIMLAFMCTDYLHVFGFMLNALRAWHWLALFGTIFHAYVLAEGRVRLGERKRDYVGVLLFACLGFGVGYDFWAICAALAVAVMLTFQPRVNPIFRGKLVVLVALMFCVPLVLRQVHVAGVLGRDFWWQDLLLSAAIKVPYLDRLIVLPSYADIEVFYRNAGILRPPASAASSWTSIAGLFEDLIRWEILPSYGLVTVTCLAVALLAAALWVVSPLLYRLRRLRTSSACSAPPTARHSSIWTAELRLLRLLCAMTIGIGVGLLVLSPLSLHIYLKHQFPLLAAPFNLAKTVLVGVLLDVVIRPLIGKVRVSSLVHRSSQAIAACGIAFIIVDHGLVQVTNLRQPALDTSWVRELNGARQSIAVSWISDAVDAFSHSWSAGSPPGFERELLDRIRAGDQPFRLSDYMLFGQRDRAARAEEYEKPNLWLYFPIEQLRNFDSPSPHCREDYLTSALTRALSQTPSAPEGTVAVVPVPGPFAPGSFIPIFGQLAPSDTFSHVEVSMDGQQRRLNYNCIYRSYAGVLQLPIDQEQRNAIVSVTAVDRGGTRHELARLALAVNSSGKVYGRRDLKPWSDDPQLTAAELVDLMKTVPVTARGGGWVLFDMRPWYASHGK
jgi:hypothetical protein